jgi:hypothetical protein
MSSYSHEAAFRIISGVRRTMKRLPAVLQVERTLAVLGRRYGRPLCLREAFFCFRVLAYWLSMALL